MTQRERCPEDGARIWYATDWLGRVAGICGTCGRQYATFAEPIAPPVLPTPRQLAQTEYETIAAKIVAHLSAHPGAQRIRIHAALAPLGKHKIDRALIRMTVSGAVICAHGARSADASANSNKGRGRRHYLPQTAPPPNQFPRTIREQVADLLARATAPMSVAEIGREIGEPCYAVRKALHGLERDHDARHKVVTVQWRGRPRKEAVWWTTRQSPPDEA